MGHQLARSCRVSELAGGLALPWHGPDLLIDHVSALSHAGLGALCFAKVMPATGLPAGAAVIVADMQANAGVQATNEAAVVLAPNARLAFARGLHWLAAGPGFQQPTSPPAVDPTAHVSATAVLGHGVRIGARTVIEHHVVIAPGVVIGADCHIKSNTVIGEAGFGFERDAEGVPVRILHLGGVTIGDRVEIGSLNTVCRATLGQTIIEDDVKTDDHVHIAHNCRVRRGALLTACAELSGGVDVGEFAWIGPNASVIQKVVLGERAFVGIGATVTKSVGAGTTVAGNPARALRALGD